MDTSVPSERLSLVASFYGPGNITSWLCIVASVLVTWCFNEEYRREDSIGADLLFVLAVPSVAAGHVIHIVFFSVVGKHESSQNLFTSPDPQIVQHAAAAEAALDVCETFSAVAVLLVFISMFHGHLKRTIAVVSVGLLTFSIEAVISVQTRGVKLSASNLTRPFLFNFFGVVVSMSIFLVVWIMAFGILILLLELRTEKTLEEQIDIESTDLQLEGDVRSVLRSHFGDTNSMLMWESQLQTDETPQLGKTHSPERRITMPLTFISMMVSPLTLLGFLVSMNFQFISSHIRVLFFIPKSSTSITELDQMVSACIGSTTLLFGLWEAYKSQRKEKETARRESSQRWATLRRAQRQRNLTYALNLLNRLNNQLDETEDETERQVLLDQRNILMINLSRMVRW